MLILRCTIENHDEIFTHVGKEKGTEMVYIAFFNLTFFLTCSVTRYAPAYMPLNYTIWRDTKEPYEVRISKSRLR